MKNIGLIGCGNIAETYFRAQDYFNNINFIACADINKTSADECAKQNNITSMSVDDLLNNQDVDIILNLTIPRAHYEISEKALIAGKHVYSEKPMAVKLSDAKKIIELANKSKLYFGNAPDTFLGGGMQKSRQLIDEGSVGKVLTGNFIFAFSGVQTFHPNPESWFQDGGGPVIDMGPYFFTALVNLLGPAKNVRARGVKFSDKRIVETGQKKVMNFLLIYRLLLQWIWSFITDQLFKASYHLMFKTMLETIWSFMVLKDLLLSQIPICLGGRF